MEKKEIAIIGAGYTGLTAAYELLKHGHKVTLYEKGSTVGGLAGDFTIEGAPIEKAYHHLFRTDTDILSLAGELGIAETLRWHNSSIGLFYGNRWFPFMTPFDLLQFSPLSFIDRIRAGLVVLYLQKTSQWQQFVKQSAYSWMKKAAGNSVTKVIWEPLLRGKFHEYYDKVSMAWLWARLHVRANSRRPGETKEKLCYPEGGFATITNALVSEIKKRGGMIRTLASVSGIRGASLTQRPSFTIDEKMTECDRIIVTAPNHVFAKLIAPDALTEEYNAKLHSILYLGAVLLVFSSTQSLSSRYWHNIHDLSAPFLVFIQHTNLVGTQAYGGNHVYYIGAYIPQNHRFFGMTQEQIEAEWFTYVTKLFSDFDQSKIREKHLFKFPQAQHIVDTSYQEKILPMQTPLAGVFLSNFTQIFPEDRGTNYAVRDGRKVAELAER